jgi:uncharacterized protein (DUF1697 family)
MALVVLLRGVNVGGHRTFRPSLLAQELSDFDVVNVGAAGTFVVRKPGSAARFRAELLRRLPIETTVVICDGRDLLGLETENPFGSAASGSDVVRFVSFLSKAGRGSSFTPVTLPSAGRWLVRLVACRERFVFGMYRRHMKTIGYLGQIDRLLGATATTRNWNTVAAIIRLLKGEENTRLPRSKRVVKRMRKAH